MNPEDELLALLPEILALEQEMHRTEVRRDRDRMEELLHPLFEEIGRSGKVYSRPDIIAEFTAGGSLPEIGVSEVNLKQVSAQLLLLSYVSFHKSTPDPRRTRRSSLWQRHADRWQIRFHQGTAMEEENQA